MIQVFRQVEPRRFEATGEQDIAGFHPNDTIALPGAPKRYLINAEGKSQLRVVAAQPDGRLTLVSDYSQPQPLGSTPFAWPDWGRLSLAVVPYSGTALTLLRDFDPEKGEAKAVVTIPTDRDPRPARLVDLNGDGVPELVFPTFWSNKVWAVEYAGSDQAPRLRELASFKDGWPRHVLPLDVNQDGKMDLLVPMSVQESIAVLLNDGQGHFTEGNPIAYPGRVGVHTLAVGQDRGGRYLLAGGSRALVLYRERKETPGSFENILLPRILAKLAKPGGTGRRGRRWLARCGGRQSGTAGIPGHLRAVVGYFRQVVGQSTGQSQTGLMPGPNCDEHAPAGIRTAGEHERKDDDQQNHDGRCAGGDSRHPDDGCDEPANLGQRYARGHAAPTPAESKPAPAPTASPATQSLPCLIRRPGSRCLLPARCQRW